MLLDNRETHQNRMNDFLDVANNLEINEKQKFSRRRRLSGQPAPALPPPAPMRRPLLDDPGPWRSFLAGEGWGGGGGA